MDILTETPVKLLFIYLQSNYTSLAVKLKILRKLIREGNITSKAQITLESLSQLILYAGSTPEKEIYAEYMITLFEEEGRRYLMLQYELNRTKFDFL